MRLKKVICISLQSNSGTIDLFIVGDIYGEGY